MMRLVLIIMISVLMVQSDDNNATPLSLPSPTPSPQSLPPVSQPNHDHLLPATYDSSNAKEVIQIAKCVARYVKTLVMYGILKISGAITKVTLRSLLR